MSISDEWPQEDLNSNHDFEQWISRDPTRETIYRGQAESDWRLRPTLDRNIDKRLSYQDRLNEEHCYLNCYRNQARRFLGSIERSSIEKEVACMTVMQHFGAPTRLLDWTWSRAVAAYFACIDESSSNGTVWWISHDAIVKSVDSEWESRGFTRRPDGQVNLEDGIFNPDIEAFVSMAFLRVPFARAQAQRSLFTIGSRLGMDHDPALAKQVCASSRGRVVIKACLKGAVIDYLERLGIDAVTLQYSGADRVGLRMSWERSRQLGKETPQDE